jgi:hypothetical protein
VWYNLQSVMHAYWPDAPQYKEFVSATYTHLDIPYRSQLYDTLSDPIRVYREDEVYARPYTMIISTRQPL